MSERDFPAHELRAMAATSSSAGVALHIGEQFCGLRHLGRRHRDRRSEPREQRRGCARRRAVHAADDMRNGKLFHEAAPRDAAVRACRKMQPASLLRRDAGEPPRRPDRHRRAHQQKVVVASRRHDGIGAGLDIPEQRRAVRVDRGRNHEDERARPVGRRDRVREREPACANRRGKCIAETFVDQADAPCAQRREPRRIGVDAEHIAAARRKRGRERQPDRSASDHDDLRRFGHRQARRGRVEHGIEAEFMAGSGPDFEMPTAKP